MSKTRPHVFGRFRAWCRKHQIPTGDCTSGQKMRVRLITSVVFFPMSSKRKEFGGLGAILADTTAFRLFFLFFFLILLTFGGSKSSTVGHIHDFDPLKP